jgi:signal transduction histidine kinase
MVMFGLVVVVFSVAFMSLIALLLQPSFDISPDTSSEQAAQMAYNAAVENIGLALIGADLLAILVVGVGAWVLAARTLKPIRESHERQQRFVADTSHEMRTPLTAILSTSEDALRGSGSPERQRAALRAIAHAASDLSNLTADLLSLAQGEDRLLRTDQQRFDLSVVVAERLALRAAAQAKVPQDVRFTPDLLVDGSPEEVGRIVDNLVDNAFRYGGTDVQVTVKTLQEQRHALVEVGDNGPGIAALDKERVFEPFYRVRSDSLAPPGTGLGLAIALMLARRNGGQLELVSQPGHGTTFRLQLRVAS